MGSGDDAGHLPCLQGFEAFVAGLLFQTADGRVPGSGQGHGTQHQAGDGLHCQHVELGTLQVLLQTDRRKHVWFSYQPLLQCAPKLCSSDSHLTSDCSSQIVQFG